MVAVASRRRAPDSLAVLQSTRAAQSDYAAASRRALHRRSRGGVPVRGASADYHYRNDGAWLWMAEVAWDLYRNSPFVGSIVDRAIEQTLQGGFQYDPDTGDAALDLDIRQWWAEVSHDPSACDHDAELCFAEQEEVVLRNVLVPGDILCLPLYDGTVQLCEGFRCQSPSRATKERPVHGVEFVPGTRRRAAYWLLKDETDPYRTGVKKSDLTPVAAWDDNGERNVWHVRFEKRSTQTRGITALAPIFDTCAYTDDLQFLQMVKARAQSLFVFIRERANLIDPEMLAQQPRLGAASERSDRMDAADRSDSQFREVGAGSVLDAGPGESIRMDSPKTPSAEYFQHVDQLLTFIGVNLGMPLTMALMRPEGTFSAYRGAVDQARLGFRKNQERLKRRFHTPYMRHKLRVRGENDEVFARALKRSANPRSKVNAYGGRWIAPGWPYMEPTKDATADLIRSAHSLASDEQIHAERGFEATVNHRRQVETRHAGYKRALAAAADLIGEYDLPQDAWTIAQHLLPLATSQNTSVSIQTSAATASPAPEPEPAGAADE